MKIIAPIQITQIDNGFIIAQGGEKPSVVAVEFAHEVTARIEVLLRDYDKVPRIIKPHHTD